MQIRKAMLGVLASIVLQLWVAGFAQASTSQTKVGKTDDITLSSITKVGTLTLQPGHYILRHKASLGSHAMHFVSFTPYSGAVRFAPTTVPIVAMSVRWNARSSH